MQHPCPTPIIFALPTTRRSALHPIAICLTHAAPQATLCHDKTTVASPARSWS